MAQNFQDALDKAFPADKPASSGAAPSGGADSRVAAFARDVGPLAARVGEEIGVDPKILIGQWGLETGWGKSVIPGTNNYGNIKDFRGSGVVARDNMNGSVDKYRAFSSPDEFGDHFTGLMSRKYGSAMNLGDNALAYGNALRRGGYAEDPNYAVKIANAADMVRKATGGKSQPELYAPRGQYIGQTEKVLADSKKRQEIAEEGYGTAFSKGFGDATDQIPELAVGAGTALADVFGMDELRDAGLGYLQKRKDESQDEARSYSSFTDSLEHGDMGRWAAYALGYGVNQLAQAAITGGVGATVGKVGLVGLLKGTAERVTAEALAKGATQELASKAGMEAAELAAKKYGAAFAMYGNTYGQELGSIYPDAVEQAKKSGNPVDLAKVFGSAGVAAALESAPEIGIAGKLIDGAGKGSKRMLGRAAGTIPKQMGLEGGTEYAQTGVEQWGAQKPLDTAEARKERIDSAAMGAIMGGPSGAIEAVPAPRADAAMGEPVVTPAGPAPQPTPQPNSPLSNAAAAGQSAQPAQAPADPIAQRLSAVQSFVDDKAFIQAVRGAQGYGPESVTELLSAFAKARNPNLDPLIRDRALTDLEGFIQSFNSRPNFTFGQSAAESTAKPGPQPGTQVAPIQQPGAVTTPTPRDDGRTLDGEIITRPEKMAGANPNQLSAPPVLGLPTEEALKAKRDADAAYEQAYQDLVKAESLGAADAELQAKQQAIRDARAQSEQAEARLKEIEQAIEGNRAKQTAEKRRTILDAILADPETANPAARLSAELTRQGFRDTQPSAEEMAAIRRFEDIKAAQAEPEVIPSAPNEMEVYQSPVQRAPAPRPAPKQEAKPKQQPARRLSPMEIRAYVEAGAVLNGDTLTLKDGTTIKLKGPQIAAARQATSQIAPAQQVESTPAQASESKGFEQESVPQEVESAQEVSAKPAGADNAMKLAREVMGGRFEATTNDANAFLRAGRAHGIPHEMMFSGDSERDARILIDLVADENLKDAPESAIVRRIASIEGRIDANMSRTISAFDPTRLGGSGAAGRMRDRARSDESRSIMRGEAERLYAELERRRSEPDNASVQSQPSSLAQSRKQNGIHTVKSSGTTEAFDVSTRTDDQLRYLAENGKPGWKESAQAELARRNAKPEIRTPIDAAAHEAATSPLNDTPQPTEAQKEAGNYKVGRVKIQGMDISIENPQGSTRSGVSPDGVRWESTMANHYGYFPGTTASDGDHLDAFLTDGAEDAPVAWVIDQKNKDGSFDEQKIVLGPRTEEEARAAYLANYEPGWDGLGAISSMPIEAFKAWAFDGKKKRKPLAYVEPAKEEAKPADPREEYANQKEQAYIAKRGGNAPPKAVEAVRIGAYREYDRLNATHQDPGQPAEAATPAVVAESIKKSAANTPLNIKKARAALLSEIDAAIANVPDENEALHAELERERAKSFDKKSVEQMAKRDPQGAYEVELAFNALRDSNIAKTAKQIGFVTFDVPGDGKFKVVNTKSKLQEFRRKVETSPGFKDAPTKPPVMRREVEQGSYTPRDAILEGDYLNAYELAKLSGKPLVFSVSSGEVPSAYTDSATADGIIDGLAFVVAREAVKDGKWYVIDPATGMLLNKSGLPTKVAALTAAKAKVKGHEDALRKVVADPTKAMPQSTLEAEWLAWAEKEEGVTQDSPKDDNRDAEQKSDDHANAIINIKSVKDLDAWLEENVADQFQLSDSSLSGSEGKDRGVGSLVLEKKTRISQGPTRGRTVDDSDVRNVFQLKDGRLVWWNNTTGDVLPVDPTDPRYTENERYKADIAEYRADNTSSRINPLDLTPKQYHAAKLKAVADEYNLTPAEVREDYETPAQIAIHNQEWIDAVRDSFRDGSDIEAKVLDRLHELRPGALASFMHDNPDARIPNGYQTPDARKAEKAEADARKDSERDAQSSIKQPSDLSDIFTGLSSRGLAKTRAEKAAAAHPRAEQIAYVQENFMDILTELEDAGIVKINCD